MIDDDSELCSLMGEFFSGHGFGLEAAHGLAKAGASVTLVQLYTTFCASCRQADKLLTAVAAETPGLAHIELDVTDEPSVATKVGVMRTPTTTSGSDFWPATCALWRAPSRWSSVAIPRCVSSKTRCEATAAF